MDPPIVIRELVWDAWNRDHIGKHDVAIEDVEEVIHGDPIVRATYKQRLQLIGAKSDGTVLSVVMGPVPLQPGCYYVFSARRASRRERQLYFQQMGDSVL